MGEAGTTSGGELRAGWRWAAAGVAFAAALTVAGLAVVTNLATDAVPASWAWASPSFRDSSILMVLRVC